MNTSNVQQKVDDKKYGNEFDRIFRKKDNVKEEFVQTPEYIEMVEDALKNCGITRKKKGPLDAREGRALLKQLTALITVAQMELLEVDRKIGKLIRTGKVPKIRKTRRT